MTETTAVVEKSLQSLQQLAPVVAQEYAEQQEAVVTEYTSEAQLLDKVVQLVGPGLRSVVNRIYSLRADQVDGPGEEVEYFPIGGLLVGGKERIPDLRNGDTRNDSGGTCSGYALYLLSDGTFHEVTWSGNWTRFSKAWNRVVGVMSDALTSEQVVKEWDFEVILQTLEKAFKAQVGARAVSTASAKRRAAKLEAINRLLEVTP